MAEDLAVDTKAEAAATPAKEYRRWMMELKLAQKREKDWRAKARGVLDAYRGKDREKNSFNILWSNTEVLRPALYNSPPKPDVRRRFRQDDPLGKAVSEVMERGLSYCTDAYDLDNCLQNDVLDALLPGRGLSRVRYVPKFKEIPEAQTPGAATPGSETTTPETPAAEGAEPGEAQEGTREEVEYEQALCDHVQWDDFLHGPGKVWEEVPWCGFRHRLTRDDLREKFGPEIGDKITLNDVDESDLNDGKHADDLKDVFKRAELWEIWDKDGKRVFFVNESYREGVIFPLDSPNGEPPLKLKNFFPVPRPLMLMEDTGNLIPEPLYEQYRAQAEEVDRLSFRINKIINACRVRFVHDSTLTELKALMDAGDNEGIPTESARAWMQNGGLDKAIWFMPIQQVAAVLKELYIARDAAKQAVYEITGISDIIRGATNPNETLGAQQLKANSSSLRLQRMKVEVQRYARDLNRLLAEVIGEHFDVQTLAQMTGLKFPTAQQKQMVQVQMQAVQARMQQPGPNGQPQQPPPAIMQQMQQAQQIMSLPSWEDIKAVISNDMQREFRVDVETDSTVAQSLQQDMEGLREVLTGIVEFWQGVGPAVQAGAVSIDVVKAITMTVVRRARMGLEIEDALEAGMKQPPPQADPNAGKAEEAKAKAQAEQAAQQAEIAKEAEITKREQAQAQSEAQAKAQQDQIDLQREQLASQEKVQLDAQKQAADVEKHRIEVKEQYDFKRWEVQENNKAKVDVANISAKASTDAAQQKAESEYGGATEEGGKKKKPIEALSEMHKEMLGAITELAKAAAAPRKAVRGADGRITRARTLPPKPRRSPCA